MTTFSSYYLRPEAPQADSARMRLQLLGVFNRHLNHVNQNRVAGALLAESGVRVRGSHPFFEWQAFLTSAELRDVLDWVSYVFDSLNSDESYAPEGTSARFVQAVREVFDKNHAAYVVTDDGRVRYRIDEAHEIARQSTLANLEGARFRATREEFEKAYDSLAAHTPDGKAAIRAIFGALENQFKLMFDVPRLDAPGIRDRLKPTIRQRHEPDQRACEAALRMAEELEKWVAAAHYYRHEAGVEEPGPPPIEVAVALVGTGTAHLRWLAGMDMFG